MNPCRAAFVVAALLFSAAASAADLPLQLTITDGSIVVSNATPGGNVVLFAAGLDGSNGVLTQRRLGHAVAADAIGSLAYKPARRMPYRTIFAAVDVETGRLALAGAPDYELQVRPFPTENLKRESDGISGMAGTEIPRAELLVVRPKGGAWRLVASEGGSGDDDKQYDGKLALDFSTAKSLVGEVAAPARLKSKDVVVLIDSARLEVFTTEILQ
ncbi:MAG TPA: hypothetical protein VE010_21860 [Thermoanaerobaculia bacterium]|nr:hypothetical protein [Thermoanaerobaculia bacterium]